MNLSAIYLAVAIVILAVIVLLIFVTNKEIREKKLTPLAGLAFAFVVAGIIFGEERVIGYGLMGIGVVFAVIDMLKKRNRTL